MAEFEQEYIGSVAVGDEVEKIWSALQYRIFLCGHRETFKQSFDFVLGEALARPAQEPVACPGADDPEDRCPRHPSECACWQVDTDHPMMQRAAPQPLHTTNCCKCGRIIDPREKKDGGDNFGAQLSDGRWTCSIECDDAVINPTHSQVAGTPSLLTDPAPSNHSRGRPDGHCGDDLVWDQFSKDYGKRSRADLCKGDMTDFALANSQFMCDRNSLDLIVYQTAAKERIRWLSVQLAAALKSEGSADA